MGVYRSPLTLAFLIAAAILATVPAGSVHAQSGERSDASQQSDATAAWRELRRETQIRLRDADDRETAVSEVMQELTAFAEAHANTTEAAAAWFNHGALASRTDQPDLAEKSLNKAVEQADDPRLKAAAQRMLSRLALRPGKTPPDFTATTIEGKRVELANYRGKVVLLDFWATWCGPCIAELPNVEDVYEKYRKKGFDIISISLDHEKQALRQFVDKRQIPWPQIYDKDRAAEKQIASLYGVNAIPQMILIGRDGKIIDTRLRGDALERAVASAVKRRPEQDDKTSKQSERSSSESRTAD